MAAWKCLLDGDDMEMSGAELAQIRVWRKFAQTTGSLTILSDPRLCTTKDYVLKE